MNCRTVEWAGTRTAAAIDELVDGDVVSFRIQVLERDVRALSNGRAVLRQSGE